MRRDNPEQIQQWQDFDGEHGRIVERRYQLLPISNWISGLDDWRDIQSIVEVTRIRIKDSGNTEEISYYISSMNGQVEKISLVIRNHWAIENNQHWILDVKFREYESLIYVQDGAQNMALFKRTLLNLLKSHPVKDSIDGKRQRACWDDDFRAEVLFG